MQEVLYLSALFFFNLFCILGTVLIVYTFITIKDIRTKIEELITFTGDRIYKMTDFSGISTGVITSIVSLIPSLFSKNSKKKNFWDL
jgi:uncharacterized metal-binding protein